MELSIRYLLRYFFFICLPSIFYKFILKIKIKRLYNRKLDLDSPERLSDKIQYIKLFNKDKRKTILSDKILVKQFVSEKLPELKYAKVYQVADSFEDINLANLPKTFILKTNHSWKTNIKVENKTTLSTEELKNISKYYDKMLKINYAFWSYYELQYKDIKPKVFAEEFLGDIENINHYEVWCFNGIAEFVSLRFLAREGEYKNKLNLQYFYNSRWELVDFYIDFKTKGNTKLSNNKDKIIQYAEVLSQDIDFVRVDFMEINNELYFGEMTFTPCSGFFQFLPDEYDLIYGKKLVLAN